MGLSAADQSSEVGMGPVKFRFARDTLTIRQSIEEGSSSGTDHTDAQGLAQQGARVIGEHV
jgi:hypothetical protein